MSRHQGLRRAACSLLCAGIALGTFAASAAAPLPIPAGVALKSWQDNGRNGRYLLQVIQGKAPKGQLTATVMSDTDCAADAQGVSHCHNILKLPNGTQITVIDSHNMHRFRCLGEGDRLTLKGVGAPWVVATLARK